MVVVPYKHLIPYACQFESYNPVNPLILQILIQTIIGTIIMGHPSETLL